MEHCPPWRALRQTALAKRRPKERTQLPLLVLQPYSVWSPAISCSMGLRGGLELFLRGEAPHGTRSPLREP